MFGWEKLDKNIISESSFSRTKADTEGSSWIFLIASISPDFEFRPDQTEPKAPLPNNSISIQSSGKTCLGKILKS